MKRQKETIMSMKGSHGLGFRVGHSWVPVSLQLDKFPSRRSAPVDFIGSWLTPLGGQFVEGAQGELIRAGGIAQYRDVRDCFKAFEQGAPSTSPALLSAGFNRHLAEHEARRVEPMKAALARMAPTDRRALQPHLDQLLKLLEQTRVATQVWWRKSAQGNATGSRKSLGAYRMMRQRWQALAGYCRREEAAAMLAVNFATPSDVAMAYLDKGVRKMLMHANIALGFGIVFGLALLAQRET